MLKKKNLRIFAVISDDIFFRDYSVHQYLEQDLGKHRLGRGEFPGEYYSNEFFADVQPEQVSDAISDIKENYNQNTENTSITMQQASCRKLSHMLLLGFGMFVQISRQLLITLFERLTAVIPIC